MEQENQSQNPTAADMATGQNTNTQSDSGQASGQIAGQADTSASGGAGGQTFDQLMAMSPKLSPFSGWLKCLRKPALSMEYSIQKRHVPDLDADAGQSGPSKQNKPSSQQGQTAPASAQNSPSGQNSDTMGVSGSFTIRYFDFALGIVGLAIVSCVMKGCCCLKRKMF